MAIDLFSKLDLNLIRIFLVLYQEKNMRKASNRLFIAQPAISKNLKKLRDHFNDDLFVKTPTGLKATEYGEQLAISLTPIVEQLSDTVNNSVIFDPAALTGVLKIAVSPIFATFMSSELFNAIHNKAPNVQLQLVNWSKISVDELKNNDVLLGIQHEMQDLSSELTGTELFIDSPYLYMRRDNFFSSPTVELTKKVDLNIATILDSDWNNSVSYFEKFSASQGQKVNVVFRSEFPSAVIETVANSDIAFPCTAIAHKYLGSDFKRSLITMSGKCFEVPVYSYYHIRNKNNRTVHWLNDVIKEIINRI
ncbi:LysR family transcriptional regulator [Vibrio breoganii]|uniref:LysR family transcriptional regulator n=1 Tax=Vibrio breoganii TaxID=553239 RepID=UPI0021C273B2|nr:LysR family transcriptional regulator [Vibrio breoganii]MDN3716621.1 LysR family transcriptional regulator [Vibrio breoganii]